MHSNIVWFDTSACLGHGHIGNVNAVQIRPSTTRYQRRGLGTDAPCTEQEKSNGSSDCFTYEAAEAGQWWKGSSWSEPDILKELPENVSNADYPTNLTTDPAADAPYIDRYRKDSQTVAYQTAGDNAEKRQSWSTSINVSGRMNWADEDLYRDLLKDYIDLFEDCDIDCQAQGSQLTTIAGLMGAIYGLVTLNAIFMFIGTWRANYRICSIYCTFGVCLFQFAALIAVGAMMFTKYNAICARSMKETMGDGNIWTMADDFYVTFSLWITSFITMFCFVCCGLCSAMGKK